jgi:hypothetical protein
MSLKFHRHYYHSAIGNMLATVLAMFLLSGYRVTPVSSDVLGCVYSSLNDRSIYKDAAKNIAYTN